eukprot:TRINITY_DN27754_c0_g1_i2.p1 TRINITY_DN27754_c0_g1~~TRINITY_DN27754_c0_g1_i2.p1  ORF type:complete len:615 (-),score=114.03 TRINITY_DN27754_c0_g1_i2:279-2123(-)
MATGLVAPPAAAASGGSMSSGAAPLGEPRDMTVLKDFRLPSDLVSMVTSYAHGAAALLKAYRTIGIDVQTSKALLMALFAPPRQKDTAPVQSTEEDRFMQQAAAADEPGDVANDALQAALRAAAATNSNPETAAALIQAANKKTAAAAQKGDRPASARMIGVLSGDGDDVPMLLPPKDFTAFSLTSTSRPLASKEFADELAKSQEEFKSIVELTKTEGDKALKTPGGGFAFASMASRAAENARASMSSKAAEKTSSAGGWTTTDTPTRAGGPVDGSSGAGGAKIFISNIPGGTGEGLILAECRKYGSTSGVFYEAASLQSFEGGWAVVTFTSLEEASTAVSRMGQKKIIFGGSIGVRHATPDDDRLIEQAKEAAAAAAAAVAEAIKDSPEEQWPITVNEAKRRDKSRSRDRRKSRSRSRKRGRRRRSRSRSGSQNKASGKKEEPRKARGLGGFDSGSGGLTGASTSGGVPSLGGELPVGGRQVGVRGSWAEFTTASGRSYYVNVVSGEKSWARPPDYDTNAVKATGMLLPPNPANTCHTNVYVGNLPVGITEVGFRQLFAPFGSIASMKLVPEIRYGFVKFTSVDEAQRCIDSGNGALINGQQIAVRFANRDRF